MTDMGEPLVSAIIIFKDEERFIGEAVTSVVAQTCEDWELLLVDDGSIDASSAMAREWAEATPKIRYLEHAEHQNLGMSASRNLGLAEARGRYVAFLDADDRWLPNKLETQLSRIEGKDEVAMVYGPLLRWLRWTGKPDAADNETLMGVGPKKRGAHLLAGQVVAPPELSVLMLQDDYFIPGGALIRRRVLDEVGRFESPFKGLYEDAVVMHKICLRYPVEVTDDITYMYRMHDESCTAQVDSDAEIDAARSTYLRWLETHLDEHDLWTPSLKRALERARRTTRRDRLRKRRALDAGRLVGRVVLPRSVRDRLRRAWFDRTRPVLVER